MEVTSMKKLCEQLITLAIQRCRLSGDPCRLSVIIRRSIVSDLPVTQISISDTGSGSSLKEFQDLKYASNRFCASRWDGVLSITTTSISDVELYHYNLNLKERALSKRLNKLPSTSKNNAKFSGTEVSMSTADDMEVIVADITLFLRKMLILKINSIALELAVDFGDLQGVQRENVVLASEMTSLPSPQSSIEILTAGLEDYAQKHGNKLVAMCQSCFSKSGKLKMGNGIACSQKQMHDVLVMEAVIMISELVEPSSSSCLKALEPKTEVLYFRDFSPCSAFQSDLKSLSSINWNSYGLTLRSITDYEGVVLLEWETLPPNMHIDIALHCYKKQYPSKVSVPPLRQRSQLERKLMKKSVTLALDDLKEKYAGVFVSTHALKIHNYAPDLARSIAGLILSSDDLNFQSECLCLLGVQAGDVEEDLVENIIKDKIISAIDINDRNPSSSRSREAAPSLFGDDHLQLQEPECMYEDCEQGEEDYFLMDF